MLDNRAMDALARLSQRKGALDQERVNWLRELLRELGGLPAETNVVPLASATLALGCAEDEATTDVGVLVGACQADPEAVAHAASLLDMAVRMQPTGRVRKPRSPATPQYARVVGE